MRWVYKGLMAASVIGASIVSAGLLPAAYAVVAVAVGTSAGYFHVSDAQAATAVANEKAGK